LFMRSRLVIGIICLMILILTMTFSACKSSSQQEAQRVLNKVQQEIQNEMNTLGREMAEAAQQLNGQDLTGQQARGILAGLLNNRPYIVDTCTVNRNGLILAVEPEKYRQAEGADIGRQEQVIRVFRTLKPALSLNFQSVEGFEAADMEYPVFSSGNDIAGAISVLFKPEVIIGDIVSRSAGNTEFSLMFMQPDGRIIYETDSTQIGRNTFVDPLYQSFPQLLTLGRKVSEKSSGTGYYNFLDPTTKETVDKEAIWVTFAMHGAEWRIVLIHTLA
jgi:branched-chain amino acid transport system substrate-binding protein